MKTISGKSVLGLGGWLLICFAAVVPGAWSMPGEWYAELIKPSWTPPGSLIGKVWSVLYTMMAVAAWLVWRQGVFSAQRRPLAIFFVQLALNAAWTPLFFGLRRPDLAFVEILFLWAAIAWTIIAFHRVDRLAAALLWPYLAWVGFAAVLNGTLWSLNRIPG
ncbi:MAG: TspO/MBR family protein [Verrucomicrobiales bacterium]